VSEVHQRIKSTPTCNPSCLSAHDDGGANPHWPIYRNFAMASQKRASKLISDSATVSWIVTQVNTLAGSIAGLAERAGQGHIGPNEVAALQQGATLLQLVMGGVQPSWFYPAPPQLPPQQTSVAAPSAAPLPPPPASATVAPPGPILTPLQQPPPPRQPAPLPAQSLAAAPPQQTTLPPLRSLFLPSPPLPQQQPQGRTDQVPEFVSGEYDSRLAAHLSCCWLQVRSGEDTPARRPHGK
jgi:hypothetical protein